MAKALALRSNVSSPAYSLRSVRTLRLALGFVALLGTILFFLGTSWDIQWHLFIGRDRTLIPPHIVMLCGVGFSGLAGLSAVLIETLWTRHNPVIAQKNIAFADAFHGSLGAYLVGFGALAAGVAFPLDSYWHALYGVDVAIWAPFHIMFAVGMAIAAFGSVYMLISAVHLAENEKASWARNIGYIGAVIAFAVQLNLFTILLFEAYGAKGTFHLGSIVINIFMLLAALLGTWIFTTAAYALPWRWSATCVAVVSLLFIGIVFLYVPSATTLLLQAEQLSYLHAGPHPVIVLLEWPCLFLLAAIIIDSLVNVVQHKNWSSRKVMLTIAASSLIGFLPLPLLHPTLSLLLIQASAIGFIISLVLGFIGGCVGSWLGQNVGQSIGTLER